MCQSQQVWATGRHFHVRAHQVVKQDVKGCPGILCKRCHGTEQVPALTRTIAPDQRISFVYRQAEPATYVPTAGSLFPRVESFVRQWRGAFPRECVPRRRRSNSMSAPAGVEVIATVDTSSAGGVGCLRVASCLRISSRMVDRRSLRPCRISAAKPFSSRKGPRSRCPVPMCLWASLSSSWDAYASTRLRSLVRGKSTEVGTFFLTVV